MTLKPSVVRVRSAWVAGLSIVTALLLAGACGGDANTERKEAGPSADASSPEYLQHRQSAALLEPLAG